MKRITTAFDVLKKGNELTNVEFWKTGGVALSLVSAVLSALVGVAVSFGWISDVPPELIMKVSSGIVTIVYAVLSYLQVATTKKIGFDDGE